jgi:hypothetical protein
MTESMRARSPAIEIEMGMTIVAGSAGGTVATAAAPGAVTTGDGTSKCREQPAVVATAVHSMKT